MKCLEGFESELLHSAQMVNVLCLLENLTVHGDSKADVINKMI